MEWTTIVTALIAAGASMFGSWAASARQRKEDAVKEAQREQKQADRLDAIERKLDIHNGYAEKFGEIGQDIVAIKKDIEYLKKNNK